MANFKSVGSMHFAISGTYGLADIRIAQGRLRDAITTYEAALQLVAEQGEPVLRGTANLYLGLSELHREQGHPEAATLHLLKSEQLGEQAALSGWTDRLCRAKARFKVDQGDLDGALVLLDEAERQYHRGPVPDVHPIAALKARVWVEQGRLPEARAWALEHGLSVKDTPSYLREFEHITLARVLIAEYQRDPTDRSMHDAMELLERLQKAAEAGKRTGSLIELLVLFALAHEAQGDTSSALMPLARALALAEPEGYVRIFVDEGEPLAQLLSVAAARGLLPDYTGKLLAAFHAEEQKPAIKSELSPALPAQPLIEPLSRRELEILHLMAQGLSNGEISQRLFLALNTVKGHNQKIFSKLQVQRRTEAVARARALGLL
jgi:LuxR family maltose regulon positive regulatory protein